MKHEADAAAPLAVFDFADEKQAIAGAIVVHGAGIRTAQAGPRLVARRRTRSDKARRRNGRREVVKKTASPGRPARARAR
jgi:hypothetical protein